MATIGEEWNDLCDEFRLAREAEMEALGKTNRAFAKDGNPSLELLDDFDAAHARTEDVKKRMDEFADKHRGRR